MKKALPIISLLIATSLSAQILPVENLNEVTGSFQQQTEGIRHIKDINGVLDKYVGTWRGTFNGKQIELVITRVTRDYTNYVQSYHQGSLLWDELMVRHKITGLNGEIIQNTLNLPEDEPEVMMKHKFYDLNTYTFSYNGVHYECGDNGILFLWYQNNNTLHLGYSLRGYVASSCTNQVERTLPLDDTVVLTKQ